MNALDKMDNDASVICCRGGVDDRGFSEGGNFVSSHHKLGAIAEMNISENYGSPNKINRRSDAEPLHKFIEEESEKNDVTEGQGDGELCSFENIQISPIATISATPRIVVEAF